MAAVQKGVASGPIGRPRLVTDMNKELVENSGALAPAERQASAVAAATRANAARSAKTVKPVKPVKPAAPPLVTKLD